MSNSVNQPPDPLTDQSRDDGAPGCEVASDAELATSSPTVAEKGGSVADTVESDVSTAAAPAVTGRHQLQRNSSGNPASNPTRLRIAVRELVDFSLRSGDLMGISVMGPTAQQGMRAHQRLQSEAPDGVQKEVTFKVDFDCDGQPVRLQGRVDLLDERADVARITEIKSVMVPPARLDASTRDLQWAQLQVYGFCYLHRRLHSVPGDASSNSPKHTPKHTSHDSSPDKHAAAGAGRPDKPAAAAAQIETEDQLHAQLSLDTLPALQADQVDLCMTWFNLLDESSSTENRNASYTELHAFVIAALRRFIAWRLKLDAHRAAVQASAAALQFPFAGYRPGQRDLAKAVYRNQRDGGVLLCEAPTGLGKTVSTLFPAVKSLGEKHVRALVYLTAKTSGREAAYDTVSLLHEHGLTLKTLVIHAKAQVCHCQNGSCERDAEGRCPLTIGFFDRLPAARERLFAAPDCHPDAINRIATEMQLCPFELALQMLPWMDLVICDYNYVFDPLVRLTWFMDNQNKLGFLLDEAHNLPDRARNMYSAELNLAQVRRLLDDSTGLPTAFVAAVESLRRALQRWAKPLGEGEHAAMETPATIDRAADKCMLAFSQLVESGGLTPAVWEWARELIRYQTIRELYGERHRTLTAVSGSGKYRHIDVRLQCINASDRLQQSFKRLRAAVVFSATLRPSAFYLHCLGLPDSTSQLALPSPFASEQLAVLACPYIDTRYKARQQSLAALLRLIADVITARTGNYLVFFPSYAYMQLVHDEFVREYPGIATPLLQPRDADPLAREAFLSAFAGDDAVTGFAIMGGIFGEGIDYPGERLVGAIVVGTGLPSLSLLQSMIADDYSADGHNGFDHAYRYPGMTRVLQTAGRVIRRESDRGIVVLVDPRFSERFYRDLFPHFWQVETCRDAGAAQRQLQHFWSLSHL